MFSCILLSCCSMLREIHTFDHIKTQDITNGIYSHQIWLKDKMLPQTHLMKNCSSTCNAKHDTYFSTQQIWESRENHDLQLHWKILEKCEAPSNTWHPWSNKILTQVNYNKKNMLQLSRNVTLSLISKQMENM